MPLVGNREASNNPKATRGRSAKNTRPMAKAKNGTTPKLITWVTSCTLVSPPVSTFWICRLIIIGYTIKKVRGMIRALRGAGLVTAPTIMPATIKLGMDQTSFF